MSGCVYVSSISHLCCDWKLGRVCLGWKLKIVFKHEEMEWVNLTTVTGWTRFLISLDIKTTTFVG